MVKKHTQAKKCKGINRANGYDGCGNMVIFRKYGLCRSCYVTWLTTTEEGKEVINRAKLTGKRKVREEEKKKLKKMKNEVTDFKKKLQNKVNQIVRLIDKDQPCLATGTRKGQVHAGHVFSRGAFPSMRYNLHNIHRQSARSNHFQADDIKLREGLRSEYGSEYFEHLEKCKETPALKFTQAEWQQFYVKARKLHNELKSTLEGIKPNEKDRIELRNYINIKLGIYHHKYAFFKLF
jgi:hypothetical protein